ncbi:MAG: ABC transporter permease, partial [Gammaproteobacteria bacterium]
MLTRIATFEMIYQLRSPLFSVSFVMFFLLTFAAATIDTVQIGNAGQVFKNAPFALLQTVGIMNLFGMFVITALVANAVIRDDETGFAPILRATRITRRDLVLGRFSGATVVACLAMTAVPLGVLVGSVMPWQDPEKIGPFVAAHYLYALFVFGLPTVLVMAAGFFALATITRSMMWCYVGVIAFLVLYTVSQLVLQEPEQDAWASLLDPFALGALFEATKYWTVTERNQSLPSLDGGLLYNRLLWLGVSAVLLVAAFTLFRMEPPSRGRASGSAGGTREPPAVAQLAQPTPGNIGAPLWAMVRLDLAFVFRSPAFGVLLVLGLFNALGALSGVIEVRGVPAFPVTRAVVEALWGAFAIIPIIIAIYYGGELVWRDRDYRMHEIIGASAAPDWAFVLPKALAITLVLLATLLAAVFGGVAFQLANGYYNLEPTAYLLWFLLPVLITSAQVGILSVFVQTVMPNKAAGWAGMLIYLVAFVSLATVGFEHTLYSFGDSARVPLSDMNGKGHFWVARAWHQLYWSAFALMLLVATHLLWRRGAETRLRPRLNRLLPRLRGAAGVWLAALTVIWLGSGAYIYYNSNVLNRYSTTPEREALQAEAERLMLPLEHTPQPTVTHVNLDVALYPRERLAVTRGSYVLRNQTPVSVTKLLISTEPLLVIEDLRLPGAVLASEHADFGFRVYDLVEPLQPGETRTLAFTTRLVERGFPNSGAQTRLVANGSFINNFEVAPTVG